jgi:integrase/recombinase XerD
MQVVEVETQDHQKRYVVIDDEGVLIEPVVRYLKYLDRIGAARNTERSVVNVQKERSYPSPPCGV